MFGISPLGWLHTLGSLPAIPLAAYMLIRYGRILPQSKAGSAYFYSMLVGAASAFFVAHQPASYVIAGVTLIFLFIGYGVGRILKNGWVPRYVETIFLTLTVFLLMVPTVTETLRRVPDGHPLVTDLKSPHLLGAQGSLLVLLIIGLTAQLWYLRKLRSRKE